HQPQNHLNLIKTSTYHLVFEHLRNLLKSPNSPDPFSKSLSHLFALDRSHTVLWVFLIQQTRNKHLVDELLQIGNDLVIANLLSPEAYFIQIVERKFVRKNWIQKLIQTLITHANTVNSEEESQSAVEMLQNLKDRRWLTKEELAFHLKQVECDQKTL
ncbi:MAG: hypothetical protein KDK40_00035, partial [Chlamydiia bacterium]|nr:hypothetical protein [Chlamydiia bacterium]